MNFDRKKPALKSVLIKYGIITILAAVLALVIYFSGVKSGTTKAAAVDDDVKTTTVVSVDLLESTVKSCSDLVTTKYHYKDVMTFTKENTKSVFGKDVTIGTDEMLLVYAGNISVGYDISEVGLNVDDSIKVIKVSLPEPKIISHEIIDDKCEVYDVKNSVFVKTNTDEILQEREDAKRSQEESLMNDSQFVAQVRSNAENVLKDFISTAKGTEGYDVVFI